MTRRLDYNAATPATDKQRELLELAFLDQMSLYEAKCRLTAIRS